MNHDAAHDATRKGDRPPASRMPTGGPDAARPSGKSFQAAPTGLGATSEPAERAEDGAVERFATSQAQATSRPAWTPGPPESIGAQSPFRPRGAASFFLLGLLLVVLALAVFALL